MEDTTVVDTGPDDNERWRSWHDKWVNDASQKEDMFATSQHFVIAIDKIKEKVLSLPSAKIGCISGMRIKNIFYSAFHSICTIFATERAKKQIETL